MELRTYSDRTCQALHLSLLGLRRQVPEIHHRQLQAGKGRHHLHRRAVAVEGDVLVVREALGIGVCGVEDAGRLSRHHLCERHKA